ncbi:chemotaxis protein [Moritella sp. 5]|uniref:hypothetical protein n=1 Tax=Moritella sp. 5 TaxID=2746231 RepID=UPI001BAADF77|nr:hypothetical protein [Moritella sp. 5]QUM81401.1 chemotaxis protein [Moritella sp. 5]
MFNIESAVTFFIIAVVIILFFSCLLKELKSTTKITSDFAALKEFINTLNERESLDSRGLSITDKNWLIENIICEHDQDKITPVKEGYRVLAKGPVASLIPDYVDGKYKSIPALLTSIGITGTFLGITFGLSQFDSSSFDSASLLVSAASLLDGMKTAFYTSLAGLFCSAVFMILLNISAGRILRAKDELSLTLSSVVLEVSPITYLRNLSTTAEGNSLDADDLASKLGKEISVAISSALDAKFSPIVDKLGDATDAMSEGNNNIQDGFDNLAQQFTAVSESLDGDKLANSVSQSIKTVMTEEVTPVLSSIKDELKQLKDIKEQSQQELAELLINKMRDDLIAPVTVELKKTADAVSASNTVTDQLNKNVESVLVNLSESISTINVFQKETMQKLQEFALSLTTILNTFKQDTQGAMTDITAGVKDALDHSVEGMALQRQAFDESTKNASGAFKDMETSLTKALDDRQVMEHKLFDNIESRMNTILTKSNEAFSQQTSVLTDAGNAASKLMDDARENLVAGLGDIDSKIHSMSNAVQVELEAFRKQYQTNLNEFFEQQNTSLEQTLGKQADKLSSVVDQFKDTFESEYKTRHNLLDNLTSQHENLQKSAKTIEKMAKAVGLHEAAKMSELQDAAATIGKQVGHLKKEYTQASIAFKEVTEDMPKAMANYFERANSSFETFFNDFDSSASAIHNRLVQAADFLIEAKIQERELDRNGATIS